MLKRFENSKLNSFKRKAPQGLRYQPGSIIGLIYIGKSYLNCIVRDTAVTFYNPVGLSEKKYVIQLIKSCDWLEPTGAVVSADGTQIGEYQRYQDLITVELFEPLSNRRTARLRANS